ncbi:MAG: ABC transporter permease, partial [Frankiaceae bacterium]|nr:ABC transporter permease [Frankiaceae bacterium]
AQLRAIGIWVACAVGLLIVVEEFFGRAKIDHVLGIPVPVGISVGLLLLGAVLGMLYALLAFGLILVYRANRIINFAHAGLGLVPGVLALLLVVNKNWPYAAAFAVMLVGSGLTGGVVELAMRRFKASPRLIATVATIGFAQIFVYLELKLPGWVGGSSGVPYQFPTPYSGLKVDIGGVIFTGDYLAIVVATVVICVVLAVFLKRSRAGIAVRAAAENSDRAQLLGVPVARLSTIVWVIAGICSGLAIFLQAPVTALPAGGSVSPLLLLYGLAAAVVARMESLPVALFAGMGIGIIQTASFVGSSKPDDAAALMLPVILLALLFQRKRLSRAFDTGVSSFKTLQEFRPIPHELRHLPEVQRARIAIAVVVVGVILGAPFIVGRTNSGFLTLIAIAAMVSISLVILSGWAGQISLGQWGFAGVGAAVAGGLATRHGTDFFVTLTVAALAGALVAVLVGIPALRLPGLFLAVVTLGLAASVQYGFLSPDHFSWVLPPSGSYVTRPSLYGGRINVTGDTSFYYVAVVCFGLAYASARSLRASRSGRVFIGLRDNVRAAQSYGINATVSRLAAFAVSGAIAAVAGALSAYQSQVDPSSFSMDLGLTAFLFAVVGGLSSLPGAVFGTIAFEAIGFLGGANISILATGVGATIVLFVLPGGLAQAGYQTRDTMLRWLARRHDIHVPSLVADLRIDETDAAADDELPAEPLRNAAEAMA